MKRFFNVEGGSTLASAAPAPRDSKGGALAAVTPLNPSSSLSMSLWEGPSRVLLYCARARYEAEELLPCRSALLAAMHAAPTNATLRFDVAVAMQKLAVTTLKSDKRRAEQVGWGATGGGGVGLKGWNRVSVEGDSLKALTGASVGHFRIKDQNGAVA